MSATERPGKKRLQELSEAVLDGGSIDWESEAARAPEVRDEIECLRRLEALGRAHRSLAGSEVAGQEDRPPSSPPLFDWGPLQALERVGSGSFGDVYRALDTRLQRHVALKLCRAEGGGGDRNDRFLEEARNLARVRHSNVLVIHGADIHDGRAGLWTDFVRGRTLSQLLDEEGPRDIEEAARIGVFLCRALAAVHAAGLLHGDLTASNVMCEEGGRILLMDFGSVSRSRDETETSSSGAVFGTPLVMAPEILRGGPPRASSDLYSLGALLYRLVTGAYPVPADTWAELLSRHDRRERVPLSSLLPDAPPAFVEVVERALERDPPARYASARELEQALILAVPGAVDPADRKQSLRSLLNELGRVPEGMCRRIGREAARKLMRAHEAGAVAGKVDLDRIWLGSDGSVEVIDSMESSRAFEGEPPSGVPPSSAVASVARIHRREIQDLCAVLFHLGTGRDWNAEAGREDPADSASCLPAGTKSLIEAPFSPFFGNLLTLVLKGDASSPIRSARDLVQALAEGEKGPWWQDRLRAIRRPPRPAPRRMQVSRETGLHGRDEYLRKLRSAYDLARSGSGRVVLLEGEAGIGKTRLVDEFVDQLRRDREDLDFLFGSYPPGGAATAAGAFLTAYRDHFGQDRLDDTLAAHLRSAPLLIPGFVALLKGLGAEPDSSPLTKDSLQTAFIHVTRSLAAERPTVVLIDDLHFASIEGRSLFAALAHAVPEHRILLIGGFRPSLPEDWTAGVERQEHCSRLTLARLSQTDVLRVLADALGSERLAEDLAPDMAIRSDGNPLFLFENLSALQEAGLVNRDADGEWVATGSLRDLPTPSSIHHMIQARFAALAEEDKELLDVACCRGFEFDPALVGEAVGLGELASLKRFALIEKRYRLIRSDGRSYLFDHHQTQQSLHEGLFEPLREQYHAALAAALERREGALEKDPQTLDGSVAVALCEHFLHGRRGREGLRYLRRALGHLAGIFRPAAMVELADRALGFSSMFAARERLDVIALKVRQLAYLGRSEEEEASLKEMLILADQVGEPLARSDARRLLGSFENRAGRVQEARIHLEEALDLTRASGDLSKEARVALTLGGLLLATASAAEARRYFGLSIDLARRAGDHALEVQGAAAFGTACHFLGQFDEAQRSYALHLEACRATGDSMGEAMTIGNQGALFLELERYDEAHACFERQLKLCREIGFRMGEAGAMGNLGSLATVFGRTAEALTHQERYLRLSREIGYRVTEAESMGHIGRTLTSLGRYEEASLQFERCLSLSREIRSVRTEANALIGLGIVAEQSGDPQGAEELYQRARAIRAELREMQGMAEVLLRLGVLFLGLGRVEEARASLLEAQALSREGRFGTVDALASIHLTSLPGGDVSQAARQFLDRESGLPVTTRMEARFLLWSGTRERSHLEVAHGLLMSLRDRAPERDRESMIPRVPLYRDIESAWTSSPA